MKSSSDTCIPYKWKSKLFHQVASFTDTNRGERPHVAACNKNFFFSGLNFRRRRGDDHQCLLQVSDFQNVQENFVAELKLQGKEAIDCIFPLTHNIFGLAREGGTLEYYSVGSQGIRRIHEWTPSSPRIGFETDPINVISSYQPFYEPENLTLCIKDEDLNTLIFDVETSKLLYNLIDIGKPFLKMDSYFHGANDDLNVTLDLRQRFTTPKDSMIGFDPNPRYACHFLLPLEENSPSPHLIACYDYSHEILPRGILSTKQAEPKWSRIDRYNAGIFGGQYLASNHTGILLRFLPRKKQNELVSVSQIGPYFGGNPSLVFDVDTQYWL